MKVYIAGPMTGRPDWNFPAFNEAAARLRSEGLEVINPAENFNGKTDLPYEAYIRKALSQIIDKDTGEVCVLPGWESSIGASLEVAVAGILGLPVTEYPRRNSLDVTVNGPIRFYSSPHDAFDDELEQIRALHDAKRSDYTGGGHKLANYRFAAQMIGVSTFEGMFMRLCEKVYRIRSVLSKGGQVAVKNEPITDDLRDMAIIPILMKLCMEGREGYGDS